MFLSTIASVLLSLSIASSVDRDRITFTNETGKPIELRVIWSNQENCTLDVDESCTISPGRNVQVRWCWKYEADGGSNCDPGSGCKATTGTTVTVDNSEDSAACRPND